MAASKMGTKNPMWKHGIWALGPEAYRKWWVDNNRERVYFANRRRKMMRREALGTHTFEQWEALKKTYNFTCPACLRSEPDIRLTQDHIKPLTKGGSDFIDNIQPLCGSCNSRKNDREIKYEIQ